jgi:hypothetical protein
MKDRKVEIRELIGDLEDVATDRGGRIEVGSTDPRHTVLISGDREGLVRLALAILDHVMSSDENKPSTSFIDNAFSENSEISNLVLNTIPKTQAPIRRLSTRPSLFAQLMRIFFR